VQIGHGIRDAVALPARAAPVLGTSSRMDGAALVIALRIAQHPGEPRSRTAARRPEPHGAAW
jgi:hypothetical protein